MRIFRQTSNNTIQITIQRQDINFTDCVDTLSEYAKDAYDSDWYVDAHKWAADIAQKFNYPLETVVAVTALLSPLTEWNLNKRRAIRVLEAWNEGNKISVHTIQTMTQVYACLSGQQFNFGPKTGAFYDCIMRPYESKDIVIDSLAASIVIGFGEIPGTYNLKENVLLMIKDVYREVARRYNVAPNRLQAATWEKANIARKSNRGLGAKAHGVFVSQPEVTLQPKELLNLLNF